MKQIGILMLFISLVLGACNTKDNRADAYGNFESMDLLVMPEIPGKLIYLHVEEGDKIPAGEIVALVDTTQLHLKKLQLLASIKAIKGKLQQVQPQIDLFEKQIAVMEKERKRVEELLAEDAATEKQLDDIKGKLDILRQQIETTRAQGANANRAILSQIPPLETQIMQIEDQIQKCFIKNPFEGTVLLKLAEISEIVAPGKPLYKIADLSKMELRAYINGDQLPHVVIGQKVIVEIDENKTNDQSLEGTISWIAERAEFTPKTIQTKEERVNLVYAIKVKLSNTEGILKIGMPGEVYFNREKSNTTE